LFRDRLDIAVVVGVDMISPFVFAGFAGLKAIDPEPSSPFSLERKGLNLGEAAVGIVLVRDADAPTGNDGIGLTGYGSSCDAHHLTRPDPGGHGLARAIHAALRDADVDPAQIDFVSAHATGTAYNDAMEAAGFASVFGPSVPPLHCAKPVTGHTLGASGAIDALVTYLALRDGIVPRSYFRGAADPSLHMAPLATEQARPLRSGLSTSSGFGGSNAALIFSRSRS